MKPKTPLEAYANFFTQFNTREAFNFASAMTYPHVRFSWRRPPVIYADVEAHALNLGWQAFLKMGWDHSVGHRADLLDVSAEKAHVAGGWTRETAENEAIMSNQVCYIATCVDGNWGIQCRLGIDQGEDNLAKSPTTREPVDRAIAFTNALASKDTESVWRHCLEDFYEIDTGQVQRYLRGTDALHTTASPDTAKLVQNGKHSASVRVASISGSVLLYLTRNDGMWYVRAGSWIE